VELEALGREALLEVGGPPLGHADLGDDVVAAHVRREQPVDEGLPISTSLASSASLNWVFWNAASGWPKALRSFT
jgi:hypothetical protein